MKWNQLKRCSCTKNEKGRSQEVQHSFTDFMITCSNCERTTIVWSNVVKEAIKQAENYRQRIREAPTLRGLYYALVSVEALPNTINAYKRLSEKLSKARKDGIFPWNLLQDKTRGRIGETSETPLEDAIGWAETEPQDQLNALKRAFERIQDPSVRFRAGTWAGQPKRVVIALEKDAVSGAVQRFTNKYGIEIFPLKGYGSTTFVKEMAGRLRQLSHDGEVEVQLLIITDFDATGEDISRWLQETLRWDFGVNVKSEKILLNLDQIEEHSLPSAPGDAEERAKMMRDPRWATWEHGFFRVELDAMLAIAPDSFEQCLLDAVEKHYDQDINQDNIEKAEEACDEAEDGIREVYEQIQEAHDLLISLTGDDN